MFVAAVSRKQRSETVTVDNLDVTNSTRPIPVTLFEMAASDIHARSVTFSAVHHDLVNRLLLQSILYQLQYVLQLSDEIRA